MRFLKVILISSALILSTSIQASTFQIQNLSESTQTELKDLKIWQTACPVPLTRLKRIQFSYYDFNGNEQQNGEILVLDAVAKKVLHIFKELHALKFPIAKARPIENYKGSDEDSMADNNTSCYNCREITGGGAPSIHSYGLAIDINPVQNPFIAFEEKGDCPTKILPAQGKDYINRTNFRPGMTEKIVELFKNNGFTVWGGKWNTPIDWQHFQTPRPLAQLLATMSFSDSEVFFELWAGAASNAKLFDGIKANENKYLDLYQQAPEKFMKIFQAHRSSLFEKEPEQALKLIESEIH